MSKKDEIDVEKAVSTLIETETILEDENNPGEYVINPYYVKVMETALPKVREILTHLENDEELVTALATISYIYWKKETNEDELELVSTYVLGIYQDHKKQDMNEFLASLRLLEKVHP